MKPSPHAMGQAPSEGSERAAFALEELDARWVPKAHALSVEIFGESASAEKYAPARWLEHLGRKGLLLGAFVDGELVGFKFGYERVPGDSFHSWLGGVRPAFRRRGIMAALTSRQEAWARARGYAFVTVNTFRERFPDMYRLLVERGYEEGRREGGKSFFRKRL